MRLASAATRQLRRQEDELLPPHVKYEIKKMS